MPARIHPAAFALLLSACATASLSLHAHQQPTLERILRGTGASAILLDAQSGQVLAQSGPSTAALPGSTLKPFLLRAALDASLIAPDTTVECRGTLTVGARNVTCTHPRDRTLFAARDALAYSCNTYFARLAERMPVQLLRQTFARLGLPTSIPLDNPDSRALLALGLIGPRITPLQLAQAYRSLALHPNPLIRDALLDSVRFGMADNANVPGLTLAGKTGTASDPAQPWTHGWFAGIVYTASGQPQNGQAQTILTVFIPHGSGADAATLAQHILTTLHP